MRRGNVHLLTRSHPADETYLLANAMSKTPRPPVVPLSQLQSGQEGDVFVLLASKESLKTREGRPFFKVTFRDARREVSAPIWEDSPLAEACRQWQAGEFYKIRGVYRETNYGPQLEIERIRAVAPSDAADGFDPAMLRPRAAFEPAAVLAELIALVEQRLGGQPLGRLVAGLLEAHRPQLLTWPAATHHHATVGGFLEHVWGVARTALYLAERYALEYPAAGLRTDLVLAGAILHDIGKLRELEERPQGAEFTPAGRLIGHVLLGRDMVREAAASAGLDDETLLRLEHIVVSHQRLAEAGAVKPPSTLEAILVAYIDELDTRFHMAAQALAEPGEGLFTTARNPLEQRLYRGPGGAPPSEPGGV